MALAAHFEITGDGAGTRGEPRRTVKLDTRGRRASGDAQAVTVHNISATGLLIECGTPLDAGERFAIDLPEASGLVAEVIWTSGSLNGCRFENPVPPAVLSGDEAAAPDGEAFGERLQRLRKARGLSLAQVGAELGVSKPTVWAWEQGRAKPVASRIDALAGLLGTTAHELLSGQDASALSELLSRSRKEIAAVYGTKPEAVKIMIEL